MDPVKGDLRWHRWVVSGAGGAISQLFGVLDANLPTGWKRLTGDDRLPFHSLVRPESALYAIDPSPTHRGVTLSLEPVGESQLRGGRVWFSGFLSSTPAPEISRAWD